MNLVNLSLPLHIVSEANERGVWHAGAKRTKEHRRIVRWSLRTIPRPPPGVPLVVTLERVAPLPLDDDNLARALKGERDEVACWARPKKDAKGRTIGDDRDPTVVWRTVQRSGRPGEYSLGIRVRAWSLAAPGGRVRPSPDADVVDLVLTPDARRDLLRALLAGGPAEVTVEGVRLTIHTAAPRSP